MQDNFQTPKRKHNEISSPEKPKSSTSNMEPTELIKLIKETINSNLDEKLKSLPTKADIEDIKCEIIAISTDINALKSENQSLKEELSKVKIENSQYKKDITWLENQIRSSKLFIKGLPSAKNPKEEVQKLFREKLNVTASTKNVRKVFDRNGKMAVIAELENEDALQQIFRNTKKLSGSDISIERDMIPNKQQHKKTFLILRKQILAVSKQHKVVVREDKLKIKDRWFKWNSDHKLVSGNADGEKELVKLYGEDIKTICLNYYQLNDDSYPKN